MKREAEMPDRSLVAGDGGKGRGVVEADLEALEESLSLTDEEGSGSEGGGAAAKKSDGSSGFRVILLICLSLLCLLLAAVGLHFIKSRIDGPSSIHAAKVESAISIIRPVPHPTYRVMLDFLIAYQVQGREMITAFRMEALFRSMLKYKNFKQNTVLFRQTVYNFLLRQNAADNTVQSWHSVFQNNLLDFMRVNLPASCPDRIRLTQVENL